MSLATSNRDGGRTNEAGHLRGVTKGFAGQILNGLAVSQRGAGANMSVDVAIGDAIVQRSDLTYGHPAWNDAVYNQVIATADGSNPRRDIIVMYIDYGQTPSTGVANNTNGVVKIKSVAGTAAGSPVDPSAATIQSSVGSGNPYVKLARVRVAAGATSISNSVIDDLRLMATAVPQGGWVYDDVYAWTYASSTTFTIAGVNVTSQFPINTRIQLYQGGTVKYFVVVDATFSTNTTVTLRGVAGATLANSPIDKPAYSYTHSPQGFPLPGSGFLALASVAQNVSSGVFTKLNFASISFDDNSELTSSGSIFTAKKAGKYTFSWGMQTSSGSDVLTSLYLNGAELARGDWNSSSGTNRSSNGSITVRLAVGDTVSVYGYITGTSLATRAAPYTYWSGGALSA